ncbi:hypothetical protein V5F40_21495 [Xanthobacter sp. DSM 14520]|uniref:hypothetical protein n=1 Tax=Xanthobacter autotrophicus (strain ATCC BAA-1158 / Py2) TaxID=78245 RepID=UPI00372B31E1
MPSDFTVLPVSLGRWSTDRKTHVSTRVMDVDERMFHLHIAPLSQQQNFPSKSTRWFFDVTERADEGVRHVARGVGYTTKQARHLAEMAVLVAAADPTAGAGLFTPVFPAAGIAPSAI